MRALRHDAADSPAIVLVHPAHGDSRAYQPLAAALEGPVRVYGIDAEGLSDGATTSDDLERMIDRCVALADEVAADATALYVGGASIGGVIAANAAERLAARGREPGPAFVVDAPAPHEGMRRRPVDPIALAGLYVRACVFSAGEALPGDLTLAEGSPHEVAETLASLGCSPLREGISLERQLEVFTACARAYFRHPQARLSRAILFIETEQEHPQHPKPPSFGWEHVAERLERGACAGTHYTLLEPANARSLAAVIDERVLGRSR